MKADGFHLAREHRLRGFDERLRERRSHRNQQHATDAVSHQCVFDSFDRVFGFVFRLWIRHAENARLQSGIL